MCKPVNECQPTKDMLGHMGVQRGEDIVENHADD